MKRFLSITCTLLFSCFAHGYELSQNQVEFVKDFQRSIELDNRDWVAENIFYPLKVKTRSGEEIIHNKEDLLRNFESVFSCEIRNVIKHQNIADIFINWQGLMIGNRGQVWITTFIENDGDKRSWIIAVNQQF